MVAPINNEEYCLEITLSGVEIEDAMPVLETVVLNDSPPPAASGEADDGPQTTGDFDGGYVSFTAEGGWYVADKAGAEDDPVYFIMNENMDGRIQIQSWTASTLGEHTANLAAQDGRSRNDDVTINGAKYIVVEEEYRIFLRTSLGEFDEASKEVGCIDLTDFSVEDAMPFLETIKFREPA